MSDDLAVVVTPGTAEMFTVYKHPEFLFEASSVSTCTVTNLECTATCDTSVIPPVSDLSGWCARQCDDVSTEVQDKEKAFTIEPFRVGKCTQEDSGMCTATCV